MRFIDKLDSKISSLCFGGAAISGEGRGYGFGKISENDSIELLLLAFEYGINLFDFAPIYGFNTAEKRAGLAFKAIREKVKFVSKSGVDWHSNGRVNMTNDPKVALKMLDQSLKNFDSDYVDIYLVHWPDSKVDIRLPLEALYNQKEKGKIKHLGLCNTNCDDLKLAKDVAPIEVVQMESNLFNQNSFNEIVSELTPSMLTMGWGTFDKGILTGSVEENRSFDKDDCRSWAPWWKKGNWKQKCSHVQKVMNNNNLNKAQLGAAALSFSQKNVDTSICGMRSTSHLESSLAWSQQPVSKDFSDEFALI